MKYPWLITLLFATSAHAYTGQELRGDCQAAEEMYAGQKSSDPFQAIRSARCIAYVAGFADSYGVSDYLAEQVGIPTENIFVIENGQVVQLENGIISMGERVPGGYVIGCFEEEIHAEQQAGTVAGIL